MRGLPYFTKVIFATITFWGERQDAYFCRSWTVRLENEDKYEVRIFYLARGVQYRVMWADESQCSGEIQEFHRIRREPSGMDL